MHEIAGDRHIREVVAMLGHSVKSADLSPGRLPNWSSLIGGCLIDLLGDRTFNVVSKIGREVAIGISTNETFFGL